MGSRRGGSVRKKSLAERPKPTFQQTVWVAMPRNSVFSTPPPPFVVCLGLILERRMLEISDCGLGGPLRLRVQSLLQCLLQDRVPVGLLGSREQGNLRKCSPSALESWRQIWRVAGRESGFPDLLGSPRPSGKSPDFAGSSPNFPGSFSATSPEVPSLWNFTAIRRFPGSFPKLPRKFPKLPRKFRDFPGGQPLSLGSLTPSPDSQKLSLAEIGVLSEALPTLLSRVPSLKIPV